MDEGGEWGEGLVLVGRGEGDGKGGGSGVEVVEVAGVDGNGYEQRPRWTCG